MQRSPDGFYNAEARELAKWSLTERDRLKATRIYKVARSLETRYRSAHPEIVNNPYHKAPHAYAE